MFYVAYAGHTVHVLKCKPCKSYDLELAPRDDSTVGPPNEYVFHCVGCHSKGTFTVPVDYKVEGFLTWDELQARVDELKVVMTITPLE
jgi:hypothetical protein